ncbi:putative surface protein SACOL0050 [Helianthus annuus]|uniref:putative surface protein SACOL0050 n=1 Tax=Helianthus annuus TaxID=4232 RepID=UPI000B8FFF7A|nr:putative surface protein SACOL0050 [Helianthus annuus]
MIYGKPSDYVPRELLKSKNGKPADLKKSMNFVKNENENCSNELAGKSEQVNETETEIEKETEPVKISTEEIEERKPDVLTNKLETSVSSDSEISSGDSGNYSCMPETSNDTSETHDKDEKLDIFYCDSEEIDRHGSSDEPDNQMADSGTLDNEHSSSKDSDCDEQLESRNVAAKESQIVSDIDCSSSDKPESVDVKDSEVDKAEKEIPVETNSEETHEISEPEEKGSMEINSTVDSTEGEIFVETFSRETPENIFSEEKGYVEINSTDDSTLDPKGSDSKEYVSNEAKSTEAVSSKKNQSRKNRRSWKKKVKKENPSLQQTES